MPPYHDPNRLFYAPTDPVMLTREQMQHLSPQELQAATDQLDQHLVFVLQQIEENFAKCNQVVVEGLLPAVEQHGENSMRIYESIKFWRPFFEAAASIRLNEPYNDDTASVGTEEPSQTSTSPDRTVSSAGDETYSSNSRRSIGSDAPDLEGTPRASNSRHDLSTASSSLPPEPHWSTDDQFASPFLSSDRALPANSAMKQPPSTSSGGIPDQQLQRLRLRDLPPDSPDVPDPQFETAVFGTGFGSSAPVAAGAAGAAGGGTVKGKGRDFDVSLDSAASPSFSLLRDTSPTRSQPRGTAKLELAPSGPGGGGDRPPAKLLDKILRKNLASPAVGRPGPGSSTPGRPARAGGGGGGKMQFPPDLPREWNGIANLSHTALDAFPSPIKRRQSVASTVGGGPGGLDGDGDDSFARMMAAAVPPPSTLRRPTHPGRPESSSASSAAYLTSSPAPVRRFPPADSEYLASSPARLVRTPAKYAAKLTARHVYESLGLDATAAMDDSPPPSIMKANHRPFDLYEHTQRQETIRRSLAPQATRDDDEAEEGGGYEGPSPTTERTQSRYLDRDADEPSFASGSNASIVQPPSFIARGGGAAGLAGDVSHTQPFNLYQHQHEQQQALQRSRRQSEVKLGQHPSAGRDYDDDDEGEGEDRTEHDIDDILLGGKTMTFRQERASLAPGDGLGRGDDFGGIVDDDNDDGHRGIDGHARAYDDEMSYAEGEGEEGEAEQRAARGEELGAFDQYGAGYGRGGEDESFDIERGLRGQEVGPGGGGGAGVGFGNRLLDGPEDTLFGMPPTQAAATARTQPPALGSRYEEDEDDTFTENQDVSSGPAQVPTRGGAGFRLHGLSEMETLHGGELLASEPFQASPLAGRWGFGGGGGGAA
ncbi:hypothetical protein JCM11491_004042 [Sporobolomyces phaffii]